MTTVWIRLGFFGGFGWGRGGDFDAPGEFTVVERADADLVGFGGANVANPGDAEAGFAVPAALYFDDFAGRSKIGDVVEAGSVFADVHGIRGLREGIAVAVLAADENAKRLRCTEVTASFPPEVWRRIGKSGAHSGPTV